MRSMLRCLVLCLVETAFSLYGLTGACLAAAGEPSGQSLPEKIWSWGLAVWYYEIKLFKGHSITGGKVIVAVAIIVFGLLAVKLAFRLLFRRLKARTQMKQSTAFAVEKLFRYIAYLLVLFFALRVVNIPLEAFAFLGGAVAIGIGFGAQNLINNFISGFIIMGERPISIGDIVEVEGILGKVEDIGARCTRVRTGDNIHILVPNSSFLEKSITNWTLSDRQIRAQVTVGVVYGSPVNQVKELLLEAASENEQVLKSPEPFVVFDDFGDNALTFTLYFWVTVTRIIEKRIIESSLRFRIDDLFRQAAIVIAFPQRDVHLDTSAPLNVRLMER